MVATSTVITRSTHSTGQFDFVLANPRLMLMLWTRSDLRIWSALAAIPFGLPRADNGNYLWIQLFYSALNAKGRAGFVMANSAPMPHLGTGIAAEAHRGTGR